MLGKNRESSELGRPQSQDRLLIDAPAARIWTILEDASQLPEWVPQVTAITSHDEREAAGSVRRCEVRLGGREGYVVERCLEATPERRVVYAVDDDSLGFTRMFARYGFSLELEPRGPDRTLVTAASFYDPASFASRVMNRLVMRRKFGTVRRQILVGLRESAEARRPEVATRPRPLRARGPVGDRGRAAPPR